MAIRQFCRDIFSGNGSITPVKSTFSRQIQIQYRPNTNISRELRCLVPSLCPMPHNSSPQFFFIFHYLHETPTQYVICSQHISMLAAYQRHRLGAYAYAWSISICSQPIKKPYEAGICSQHISMLAAYQRHRLGAYAYAWSISICSQPI